MEPKNEVNKYAVAVFDNEKNVIGHLRNEKTIFYFLKTNPLNIYHAKVTGKTVNLGNNKGMRTLCLLQFTGSCKMMNILQELICKL